MASASGNPVTVVAVVGPTASGKSDLGVALAQALGGEVVNADSMQVYRGMDVGTAKLTPAERHGVPHHMLDLWEVTEVVSVAEYQKLARSVVDGSARGVDRAGGGRRLGPLRARAARRPRVPRHRSGGACAARGRARRRRVRRPAPAAGRRRPRGRDGDPADERTPHRARARGRRDHRSSVHGVAPRGARRLPQRADRPRRAASGARCADRRARRADVVGRSRRRGTSAARRRTARRAYGVARARLRAGDPLPRRRVQRGGGAGRDPARDPPLRPPPRTPGSAATTECSGCRTTPTTSCPEPSPPSTPTGTKPPAKDKTRPSRAPSVLYFVAPWVDQGSSTALVDPYS